MHAVEGVDALLHQTHLRNGCGSSPKTIEARPSVWVCRHGALLTERVGVSVRLGAGARWSSSVPRAPVSELDDRGRFASSREGRAVTSGSESG